jgi:hypothetical protein
MKKATVLITCLALFGNTLFGIMYWSMSPDNLAILPQWVILNVGFLYLAFKLRKISKLKIKLEELKTKYNIHPQDKK